MFSGIGDLLANPLLWKVLGAYWVFSALVSAVPEPKSDSYAVHVFVFRFLHALSGNLNRAAVSLKVPGVLPDEPKQ